VPSPVASDVFLYADGGSGHVCDLGSAPSAGQWDVLCVNSNATVSTPTGFTLAEQAVTNQGAYVFVREALGSEGSTVTVTNASGSQNVHVAWSRWPATLIALDTSTNTQANGSSGNSTPTHSTGTLSSSGQLVIAFGAIHSIGTAGQTSPTWSSGYTAITSSAAQGTGATGVRGYVGYKENAGTAAEAPQVSWSGDGAQNRYMLSVSFTVDAAVAATLAGTGPAGASTLTASLDLPATLAGSGPGGTSAVAATYSAPGVTPRTVYVGWNGYATIVRKGIEQRVRDEAGPPTNCPNDGTNLAIDATGTYRCPFDGWTWQGEAVTW
jgi:hypothetical protein